MTLPEIKLAPDVVFNIGNFNVTNSMISMVLTSVFLILIALFIRKNAGIRPSKSQVAFETLYQVIFDKMILAFGSTQEARRHAPLIVTLFIFLLLANQFSLIPLLSSITIGADSVYLFNTPTVHYSLTIALTLVVIFVSHAVAFFMNPGNHIANYINIRQFFRMKSAKELPMMIVNLLLGILELVGQVAKIISLSTRLFGNMFAGAAVVLIISSLSVFTNFLAPIPFLVLSTVGGLVQSFVFAILSTLYISSAVNAVKQSTH